MAGSVGGYVQWSGDTAPPQIQYMSNQWFHKNYELLTVAEKAQFVTKYIALNNLEVQANDKTRSPLLEGAAAPFIAVGKIVDSPGQLLEWGKALGVILSDLLDPHFWERVGIGILGLLMLWVGLHMMGKVSSLPSVPKPPLVA